MSDNFVEKLNSFVSGCSLIHEEYMAKQFPNLLPDIIKIGNIGKRYVRIVRDRQGEIGASVHCFVDRTNGDVLKAASWKAPAKHARGNIFDDHNGLANMKEYGPAYLR